MLNVYIYIYGITNVVVHIVVVLRTIRDLSERPEDCVGGYSPYDAQLCDDNKKKYLKVRVGGYCRKVIY